MNGKINSSINSDISSKINKNSRISFSKYPILPDLKYVAGSTFMHHLHPLTKLVLLIVFSVSVFTIEHWAGGILLLLILLCGYKAAQLGLSYFVRKLRFILIFSALIIVVQVIFVKEGVLLLEIPLPFLSITVWSVAIENGIRLGLRFINIMGASFLFVTITQPQSLAYSLMQIGIPYRYGFMLITALRFIPVFRQEFNQIKNAHLAKGISFTGISIKTVTRMVQYVFIPMIVSALSKIASLAVSMEGRAFGKYKSRTFMQRQVFTITDILVTATSILASICIWIMI
jgi:energy-coupling factor transport system permease protein